MELLVSLNASAQELALAGLRRRYPAAGPTELRRRLADILLGQDLAHVSNSIPIRKPAHLSNPFVCLGQSQGSVE